MYDACLELLLAPLRAAGPRVVRPQALDARPVYAFLHSFIVDYKEAWRLLGLMKGHPARYVLDKGSFFDPDVLVPENHRTEEKMAAVLDRISR